MEQWEYLTTFIKADAQSKTASEFLKRFKPDWKKPPQYTPEAMMPELDTLGAQGWELIHMQPVANVGRKGDVFFTGGGGAAWSSVYFCVFKRRKPALTTPGG